MKPDTINHDTASGIALRALGWILADEDRASRLLALTGMAPDALRYRLEEPLVLAAILQFLEQYEPDLLACAESIEEDPERIVAARMTLDPEVTE